MALHVIKQIIEIEKVNSVEFKKKEEELKDKEAKIIAQKNILQLRMKLMIY